jgi:hypothetical protein
LQHGILAKEDAMSPCNFCMFTSKMEEEKQEYSTIFLSLLWLKFEHDSTYGGFFMISWHDTVWLL